ncbi:MAG: hypothetical protein PHR28_13040 [candidate division Zixibacteria bacterium]|nr:hypothetical protein [candidate division Zixibacteria bacterium]
MQTKIEKLKLEITKLEDQLEKDHFRGIVDKAKVEQNYSRLKRLRRELKELEDEQGK